MRVTPGGLRRLLMLCVPVLAAALTACSGGVIGSGSKPAFMTVTTAGNTSTLNLGALQTYECLTYGLAAFMEFTNGQVGNFTTRVVWSSSDPSVVEISNGDIPISGETTTPTAADPTGAVFYPPGTMIPLSPGSAIVTANFDGIVAQLLVSVAAPQSITVKPRIENIPIPQAELTPAYTFYMGAGTTQDLQVTALLNNIETDVSAYADWTFYKFNNPSVATIQPITASGVKTGGRITALTPGGPLIPEAYFPTCPLNSTVEGNNLGADGPDPGTPDLSFTVSFINSIALQPEFSNDNRQLIVGQTEKFFVIASLADGNTQDVSLQSALTSSDPAALAFSATPGNTNVMLGVAAGGPAVIGASFTQGGTLIQADSVVYSANTGILVNFTVCWTPIPNPNNLPCNSDDAALVENRLSPQVQYHAIGDFDDGTLFFDITRQVTWASAGPEATISNSAGTVGVATAGNVQGSSVITGTGTVQSGSFVQTSQINVNPPGPGPGE
jgi:hypothetical protein